MQEFAVVFASLVVVLRYANPEVETFLSLLFADMQGRPGEQPAEQVFDIVVDPDGFQVTLAENGDILTFGKLGVAFAATLFDRVLFHLLNRNKTGVALHAGAVAHGQQLVLIPGQSGAGKSTLAAWLTARGYSYQTDELVFLPSSAQRQARSFTRPFNMKNGSKEIVRALFSRKDSSTVLDDEQGMIVPHRVLNPHFCKVEAAPAMLLFPAYQAGVPLRIEPVPRAQAGAYLMASDVNGRNLPDHGFHQLMAIARVTPAYRLSFSSFDGLGEAIETLLQSCQPSQ